MTINPGWYKDPAEPATQRYWDGEGWAGASLPLDATPPEGPLPLPPPPSPPPAAPAPGKSPAQHAPPPAIPYRMLQPVRPHGLAVASPGARLVARLIDMSAVLLLN